VHVAVDQPRGHAGCGPTWNSAFVEGSACARGFTNDQAEPRGSPKPPKAMARSKPSLPFAF
jgi:hypothetical protein